MLVDYIIEDSPSGLSPNKNEKNALLAEDDDYDQSTRMSPLIK